jgi:hypothetical protein
MLRRYISPISSVRRISQARNYINRCQPYAGFLLDLSFGTENVGDKFPKRRLTCDGLHGVISRMIEMFITTAVRASNHTNLNCVHNFYIRYKTENIRS